MTPLDRVHAVASREDFGGRLEAIVLDGAQWLCGSRHGVVLALRSPSGEEATALPHGYVERDARQRPANDVTAAWAAGLSLGLWLGRAA